MKKFLILLISLLSFVQVYSSDINLAGNKKNIGNFYKFGQFHKYIEYTLKIKKPELYGKIGKSFFFLGNYKMASKYLLLGYKTSKNLDLLNFYTKCQIELNNSNDIAKRLEKCIGSNDYDTLALGLYYILHKRNEYLNNYTDSLIIKFPASKLSYIAEKHLLYDKLSSLASNKNPDSLFLDFISKYRDTYIFNEALIKYTEYLFKRRNKNALYKFLQDSLASTETKSIITEHLLNLHFYKSDMKTIILSSIKDSLLPPPYITVNEWRLRKNQTAIRIRIDLARILIRKRQFKKALLYLQDAKNYTSSFYSQLTYKALIDYYEGISLLRMRNYAAARKTIINGLMNNNGNRNLFDKLSNLYKRNFAGSPLVYARKIKKYNGPIFRNLTTLRGLKGVKGYRIASADIDNDNYPDLLIDGKLYHNKRGLKFVDITEKAGLETDYSDLFFFADFNNDENEDILLANHKKGITIYKNLGNGIFRAVWRDTTIKDYSAIAPLYIKNNRYPGVIIAIRDNAVNGKLLLLTKKDSFSFKKNIFPFSYTNAVNGMTIFDKGIYLSNFNMKNNLLLKFERKHFRDYSRELHIAGINHDGWWGNSVGTFTGDVNSDGLIDLVVCNITKPDNITYTDMTKIYIAKNGCFKDVLKSSGIKYDGENINPIIDDLNNDGYNDIYITSRNRSHLYLNNGNGTFSDITYLSNAGLYNTYGIISIDFDRDGDQDLIVCSPDGVKLLENIRRNRNTYLNMKIYGNESGYDAFGTTVTLFFNDFRIKKFIHTMDGIGNQNDRILHFGLNLDYGPIRKIKITFPSGKVSYLYNVKRGGLLKIHE